MPNVVKELEIIKEHIDRTHVINMQGLPKKADHPELSLEQAIKNVDFHQRNYKAAQRAHKTLERYIHTYFQYPYPNLDTVPWFK